MLKFCLFAASLFIISFSRLTAQTCYLEKYLVSADGNTDTTFYTYDKETHLLKQLIAPSSDDATGETFSYYEGQLTSIYEALRSNNYQYGYTHDCFYNDKGLLEQVVDYDDLRVSNSYQAFSYDNKNRLVQATWYETSYLDTGIISFARYSYDGDKMIKMEDYGEYPAPDSPPQYVTVYEYADKKNPTFGQYSVYSPSLTEKYVVTKLVCSNAEGDIVDDYSYTRECTYNKAGYPTKCTVKYLDGTVKETETYIYDCTD